MLSFHFLRPWFLLGWLPCILLWLHVRKTQQNHGWLQVIDEHLQPALMQTQVASKINFNNLLFIMLGLACMAMSGPAWKKLPVPLLTNASAKVILLDISSSMLVADLTPNRLQRAKFLIQDALHNHKTLPLGLIAYTSEPFIVSPITEDSRTIEALLPDLNTHTAPVDGNKLSEAIALATQVLKKTKAQTGNILILTGTSPTEDAIRSAEDASTQGYDISIIQIARTQTVSPTFDTFAKQGHGIAISIETKNALDQWLSYIHNKEQKQYSVKKIPQWEDEGPWFLLPILLIFLGIFQKNRINSLLE